MAIASANDAGGGGRVFGGTEANFVERMNVSKGLGMKGTTFANASGLPTPEGEPGCITTAQDVAIMAGDHPAPS